LKSRGRLSLAASPSVFGADRKISSYEPHRATISPQEIWPGGRGLI